MLKTGNRADPGISPIERALARTVAIIPMLNEEDSIGRVLNELPGLQQVIVVDNGCTDDSPRIARENGALVVRQPRRGYGAACLAGLRAAERLQHESGCDIRFILFIDADYSDYPRQATRIIQPLADGVFDFVIGSRLKGNRERGAMPVQALFGNRLACFLMRVFWGGRFTDLGPFRAIRFDALKGLHMADQGFGWTIEMQIKALRNRLRCVEVPVDYRRRVGASKISGTIAGTVKAGYRILYTIFKYRFLRTR